MEQQKADGQAQELHRAIEATIARGHPQGLPNKIDDGGPAFPDPCAAHPGSFPPDESKGMTLREYAAIKLRVPDSGLDWLDAMIQKSRRDVFAGQVLPGLLANKGVDADAAWVWAGAAYKMADAMLAELENHHE